MFAIFNKLVPTIEKLEKSLPSIFHSSDNHTQINRWASNKEKSSRNTNSPASVNI